MTDLRWIKPGERDYLQPATDGARKCRAKCHDAGLQLYTCTRAPKHSGQHATHSFTGMQQATWGRRSK